MTPLFWSQLNFLRQLLQALWLWVMLRWHLGITAGGHCVSTLAWHSKLWHRIAGGEGEARELRARRLDPVQPTGAQAAGTVVSGCFSWSL